MIIGIDHGYYAIKTRHCSFPAGLTCYGSHEPYTRQSVLEVDGQFYVCGTGRQPVRCDKTENDTYYLLTLAALAQEIKMRGAPNESSVKIAAGLPLTTMQQILPKFFHHSAFGAMKHMKLVTLPVPDSSWSRQFGWPRPAGRCL